MSAVLLNLVDNYHWNLFCYLNVFCRLLVIPIHAPCLQQRLIIDWHLHCTSYSSDKAIQSFRYLLNKKSYHLCIKIESRFQFSCVISIEARAVIQCDVKWMLSLFFKRNVEHDWLDTLFIIDLSEARNGQRIFVLVLSCLTLFFSLKPGNNNQILQLLLPFNSND